jgi:ABC-type lipoprotein release transport system permease subunit
MRLSSVCSLAFKYLLRYRRRYLFLATALSAGFCIVTVLVTQKDGMLESVYASAQSHYAGDIVFSGVDKDSGRRNHMDFGTVSAIVKAVDDSGVRYDRIVKRTVLALNDRLYYNGVQVNLKYATGIDWENEKDYLDSLSWRDGGYDTPRDDTLFISAPVAARLGAVRGDSLVMEVLTRNDQKNTGNFIIGGIIEDYSLFGFYKVYVSRETLNRLARFEDEDASHVGVFIPRKNMADTTRFVIYEKLKNWVDTAPPPETRDVWEDATGEDWSGIRVFPLTLAVYLSEVSQILETLNILSYFLYVIMLLIILVSAVVTYRLILHERTRELGTMRAIGFRSRTIRLVLFMENLFLATVSIIAGILISLIINLALSRISFSWIPSFEIFMKNGRLAARYTAASLALNALAVYSILFVAVWFPSLALSKRSLPEMLSAGMKG